MYLNKRRLLYEGSGTLSEDMSNKRAMGGRIRRTAVIMHPILALDSTVHELLVAS